MVEALLYTELSDTCCQIAKEHDSGVEFCFAERICMQNASVTENGVNSNAVRVSVAMVTYNGAMFLREQLDSILEQLGSQDELVLSDDGSKDDTLSIIKEYQERYDCIRLLQGPGQGIKKNVEWALKHCRGQYIFLADQDDVWMPDKVKQVLELFVTTGATLVIHDAVVFGEDKGKPIMDSFFSFRQAKAGVVKNVVKNSYIGCCMAFRRELLEKALPIPKQIEMHDQWIGILNDIYGKQSYFYEKPLIYYRRHGENNSEMTHYGLGRMLRNRIVFLIMLVGRLCRR